MQNKRQAIIDTATRLFYAHGYHVIGIDRIIAEAGVAKMTLYKHFSSKTDLICTALKERDTQFQESLFTFVCTFHEPLEKLKAVFTWYDCWLHQESFNGCMFIRAAIEYSDPDNEIFLIAKRHKEIIQGYITEIINEILAERIALRLGVQLHQILEGAIVTALIFSDRNAAITASRTAAAALKAEGLMTDKFA